VLVQYGEKQAVPVIYLLVQALLSCALMQAAAYGQYLLILIPTRLSVLLPLLTVEVSLLLWCQHVQLLHRPMEVPRFQASRCVMVHQRCGQGMELGIQVLPQPELQGAGGRGAEGGHILPVYLLQHAI
jgi:hypothetical protein